MDLLDGGGGSRGDGAAASAASASLCVASLALLHSLLLHSARDFSTLAQFQSILAVGLFLSPQNRRLYWDQQTVAIATLDGVRRLIQLWLRAHSLRHFGLLFAFLLDVVGPTLLPRRRNWKTEAQTKDWLLLLFGLLLVAGVDAQEYGALLHTLLLVGLQLLLQVAAESAVLRAVAVDGKEASSVTLLAKIASVVFAALLEMMTPESSVVAQRVANDRATEDGGVMGLSTWTFYLIAAAGCQFAAVQLQTKERSLSSTTQAQAQVVSSAAGILLAIFVPAWEGAWLRCVLDILACSVILYGLAVRWWNAGSRNEANSDGEGYLGTYRSSASGSSDKSGMLAGATHVLRVLWSRRASRQLLLFLSANVAFMFVELGVGLYTNSLGLMGDAGHMLFDNGALVIGLAASYIGQLPPDAKFTYGYGRVEVLSGFLNSLLLLVVSFHLLTEAASRFMDPPEVSTDHLLLTSTAGLLVNLVGLFCFHDHVHGHGHSHGDASHSGGCGSGHGHSHGNTPHQSHGEDASEGGGHGGNSNMYGVYLHVLADTLGSVGVIISSVLIQMYEWHVADSASSALISLLILGSTLPLLRDTARQLLQGAPQELEGKVNAALRDVQAQVPGVERIAQWNIWHHAGDVSVATLHLEVASSADEQQVLRQTQAIFQRHARLDKFLSVQISKPRVIPTTALQGLTSEEPMILSSCTTGHGHSHGHDHHHGHAHRNGVVPRTTMFPLLSHPTETYHWQPSPISPTMSTHENPAGDDSQFFVASSVKAFNNSHDHGHRYQFTSSVAPPSPDVHGHQHHQHQRHQRQQQLNAAGFSGVKRW